MMALHAMAEGKCTAYPVHNPLSKAFQDIVAEEIVWALLVFCHDF